MNNLLELAQGYLANAELSIPPLTKLLIFRARADHLAKRNRIVEAFAYFREVEVEPYNRVSGFQLYCCITQFVMAVTFHKVEESRLYLERLMTNIPPIFVIAFRSNAFLKYHFFINIHLLFRPCYPLFHAIYSKHFPQIPSINRVAETELLLPNEIGSCWMFLAQDSLFGLPQTGKEYKMCYLFFGIMRPLPDRGHLSTPNVPILVQIEALYFH